MQRFMNRMKERGLDSVLVVVGGVIPDQDIPKLINDIGVSHVFLPGTPLKNIVDFLQSHQA
jgi:methylmalonyl-CoA mutase C-terminal domain/subunit